MSEALGGYVARFRKINDLVLTYRKVSPAYLKLPVYHAGPQTWNKTSSYYRGPNK